MACDYGRIEDLAQAGQFNEALELAQQHLRQQPKDGRALNDAGAILFALGRHDEAVEHLTAALRVFDDKPGETLWNLAEVYLASRRPMDALALFDDLVAAEVFSADLANRTAQLFIEAGDYAAAMETLLYSRNVLPAQPPLEEIIEKVRCLRPKVALAWESDEASAPLAIRQFLAGRFAVRELRARQAAQLRELMEWCDILWVHSPALAAPASQPPKTCAVVFPVPADEGLSWARNVRPEGIDVYLVANAAMKDRLAALAPELRDRAHVLPVSADVDLAGLNAVFLSVEKALRSPQGGRRGLLASAASAAGAA
jgi:hypothetical protein